MSLRIGRNEWAVAGFLCATLLVLSGLGWVTAAALRMEREQATAQSDAAFHRQIDLAMWRLENLVSPIRAAEAARPLEHYRAFYSPSVALSPNGEYLNTQSVLEPSPLMTAELPEWQLFHFQVSRKTGWSSPQVVVGEPATWAVRSAFRPRIEASGKHPQQLLAELAQDIPPDTLLARLGDGKQVPADLRCYICPTDLTALSVGLQREQTVRQNQQVAVQNWAQVQNSPSQSQSPEAFFCSSDRHQNTASCEACRLAPPGLPPIVPIWLPSLRGERRLAWVRPVATHNGLEVQGVLLDWDQLQALLVHEVSDLFPTATIEPDPMPSERAPTKMCNLPVRLNVGEPPAAKVRGWTSLRVGLASAWLAAVVAIGFVGWGGWALLELSERRHQFVSAVTHELRTPVTTLRLYLDMLASGMVPDETRRAEYLRTLCVESDRLAGLIDNVLNYARLENCHPNLHRTALEVQQVLIEMRQVFEPRMGPAGKSLLIEDTTPPRALIHTDFAVVRQILTNLLDNAFKHTAGACDSRVWLRATQEPNGCVTFQVEDGGPGIPVSDQKRIFSPFWRGSGANGCPAPGVGLGLALARRWTKLLGGTLRVESPVRESLGARFSLILPNQRQWDRERSEVGGER